MAEYAAVEREQDFRGLLDRLCRVGGPAVRTRVRIDDNQALWVIRAQKAGIEPSQIANHAIVLAGVKHVADRCYLQGRLRDGAGGLHAMPPGPWPLGFSAVFNVELGGSTRAIASWAERNLSENTDMLVRDGIGILNACVALEPPVEVGAGVATDPASFVGIRSQRLLADAFLDSLRAVPPPDRVPQ